MSKNGNSQDKEVVETKTRKITNRDSSKSVVLPRFMKALASLRNAKYVEVKTIKEVKNGKEELYVEIRLLKEDEKQK
jgi:hypothetical protein